MVRIVDSLWNIVEVSPHDPVLMRSDGSFTLGSCYNYYKTIYVSNSLSLDKQRQVLAHELTHAFIFELNIYIPAIEEEKICNLVADYGEDVFDMVDLLTITFKRARA